MTTAAPGTPAAFETPLTRLLGVRHPILNAPMGGTAGGRLAAAVSRAGGLGLVGGGYGDVAWLERELAEVDGERVGIGFVTFSLDEDDRALHLALEAHPVAVQLSFGDPRPHAAAVRGAGALLLCGVQTPDEVALAIEAGADVLVAGGSDAGGHGRNGPSTMAVVPAVRALAGGRPVVAAGGAGDGRGLLAALALGADGVSMGTRFVVTDEALTTEPEVATILDAAASDTVRTPVFDVARGPAWPDGHDGRAVRNVLVDAWDAGIGAERATEMFAASAEDDVDVRPVWAGESAGVVHELVSAEQVVEDVVDGARRALEELDALRVAPTEVLG